MRPTLKVLRCDSMTETVTAARLFEALVRRLLEAQGFRTQDLAESGKDEGFDFLARRGSEVWAVEVKYYRTERA